MAKKSKDPKIIPYRRSLNINVGMIIFAIIFIYMAFSVYTYLKKEKIQFYEVVEGSIVNDHSHTGIILREESVQYTDRAGYINYYVREGKRAAVGTRIYSIDESGSIADYFADNPDANVTLTDSNLSDIKRQLSAFAMSWDPYSFREVYDLQYTLEAAVMEYVNLNAVDSLDALMEQTGTQFIQARAPASGVVSYGIDGYEGLQANAVTSDSFDRAGYSKSITKSGKLVENGAAVYKLVTSDDWSIIFPLTEGEITEYSGRDRLHITFDRDNLELDGGFSSFTGTDGNVYGRLDFGQYMVQFVSDRYVNFEVSAQRSVGLKIPVTAVTSKSFYLVPLDYMTQGGDSSDTGFLKEVYSETGETSVQFTPATIYYSTDGYYYIDMREDAAIRAGDYLVKPESQERFQVGQSAVLQGVYNINKGYAVFKQIEILSSNDEYYTVRKGMNYGLSVYDHIVLDAETVEEGQLIYQ